jgi:Recombination endonuclease VII
VTFAKKSARYVPPMTEEEYAERLAAQGGVCAIKGCGARPSEKRRLDRDHDHKTGRLRGLLCHSCNRAMPAHITPERLRNLADYLEYS